MKAQRVNHIAQSLRLACCRLRRSFDHCAVAARRLARGPRVPCRSHKAHLPVSLPQMRAGPRPPHGFDALANDRSAMLALGCFPWLRSWDGHMCIEAVSSVSRVLALACSGSLLLLVVAAAAVRSPFSRVVLSRPHSLGVPGRNAFDQPQPPLHLSHLTFRVGHGHHAEAAVCTMGFRRPGPIRSELTAVLLCTRAGP